MIPPSLNFNFFEWYKEFVISKIENLSMNDFLDIKEKLDPFREDIYEENILDLLGLELMWKDKLLDYDDLKNKIKLISLDNFKGWVLKTMKNPALNIRY